MAEFKQVVITHKGQALMSKLMSGSGTAEFTAIKISDTSYTDEQLEGLTSLGSIKQVVPISKVTRTNDVAVQVEGAISNTDLKVGYYMRTLGLFAKDPNEGEILYAVTSASQAGYMPPYNGRTTSGAFFRLVTTIGNAKNVTLQVNPSAVATIGDIQDLQEQVNDLKGIIGYTENDIYGLEVDFENNKFTRLAGAKNRTPGASFDNLGPWNRRRCIIAEDDGQVLAYEGDPGYITTGALAKEITKGGKTYPIGTRVSVMVEQPKFYYRVVPLKITSNSLNNKILKKVRYYVTSTNHDGFSLHPAFIGSDFSEKDKIYLSAYDNSVYNAKLPGMDVTASRLTSIADQVPQTGSLTDFISLFQESGPGAGSVQYGTFESWKLQTYAMSQLLFVIEYAGFNSQFLLGYGASDNGKQFLTGVADRNKTASTRENNLPIIYRGEENLWGNTIKLFKEFYVVSQNTTIEIRTASGRTVYKYQRFTGGMGSATCLLYSNDNDWFLFPFDDGSNRTLPIGDGIGYPSTDTREKIVVWGNNLGPYSGLFNLGLDLTSSSVTNNGNARKIFYPRN